MVPFPSQEPDSLSSESLPEEQMIHEGYQKDPGNIWAWVLIIAGVSALLWGTLSQYANYMQETVGPRPFLQVSNRAISTFLWQNPEQMRAHVKVKSGYLPSFAVGDGFRLDPSLADEWAIAPPEVLFRYHTWHRLLGAIWFPRPIPAREFMTFLQETPQWTPQYWKAAPPSYVTFLESLDASSTVDLAALTFTTLPQEVRIAFQGWKNFQLEGKGIERMQPTYREVQQFLALYPTYRRHYWQNIIDSRQGSYLGSLSTHEPNESIVPQEEIPPFLRVALYNFKESAAHH